MRQAFTRALARAALIALVAASGCVASGDDEASLESSGLGDDVSAEPCATSFDCPTSAFCIEGRCVAGTCR